jgi:glycosyltransferase involved in cell wall biosynthesis
MISILITTKNRPELISRQIAHIKNELACFDQDYELIIYDDNSSVPLKVINGRQQHVQIFRGEHSIGLIAARNILISKSHSNSKFLLFVDDDIFIYNMAIAISKGVHEIKNEGYSIVTIPFINLPIYRESQVRSNKFLFNMNRYNHETVFFCGGSCIIEKSIFENVGTFEEEYHYSLEEEDLSIRMYNEGFKQKYLYGINILSIHDQPPNKAWVDRYVLLCANRILFHYKYNPSLLLRFLMNTVYLLIYFVKTKSLKKIIEALKLYQIKKKNIVVHRLTLNSYCRYLLKRYFNV